MNAALKASAAPAGDTVAVLAVPPVPSAGNSNVNIALQMSDQQQQQQ